MHERRSTSDSTTLLAYFGDVYTMTLTTHITKGKTKMIPVA